MKHLSPLRIACYLLLLFAFGHTAGGLFTHTQGSIASELVWSGMKEVHFDFQGTDSTYYDFWLGFGLTATIFLLLSAFLAWHLGGMSREQRRPFNFVLWGLFLAYAANTYLAWRYFFPAPTVLSGVLTLIFGWEAMNTGKES